MALTHEKKDRHLYPLFGFVAFIESSYHLRRKAVIKGTSNVPGGFVRLLLEDKNKKSGV